MNQIVATEEEKKALLKKKRHEYYLANKEKFSEWARVYRETHHDQYVAKQKEWLSNHPNFYNDYYNNNKEERRAYINKWRADNREHFNEQCRNSRRKYCENNREKANKYAREWQAQHPEQALERNTRRRFSLLNQTPAWLTKEDIAEMVAIYAKARKISKETGIKHHVDHIIPLRGKMACGFHVPWNLQIIPCSENSRKYNLYEVKVESFDTTILFRNKLKVA